MYYQNKELEVVYQNLYAGDKMTLKKQKENIVSSFLEQYNFLKIVNCESAHRSQKSQFFNAVDAGKILAAK